MKKLLIVTLLGIVLVGILVILNSDSGRGSTPANANFGRTLVLYAEDLRFNSTNPNITLKVGERVKVILTNKDIVVHNFRVRGIPINSREIVKEGERDEFILTIAKPGNYTYFCTHHPVIMDGPIIVEY